MKFKMFLVVFFAAVLTVSSYSQVHLGIGGEVGINIANLSTTPDLSTSSRTGFIVGGDFEIGFSKMFAVQPEVRFILKGASANDGAGGTIYYKLSYLDIPVLLKVTFPLTEVKPYIFAGPVLGINMAANYEDDNGGNTTTGALQNISGTDFGILFGGGVGFKIAPKIDLFVNFGYQVGLSNLNTNNSNSTAKNNGIQITAGAMFGL